MSTSEFSLARLIAKFFSAWESAGGRRADLNRAAEDPALLQGMIDVLRGRAVISPVVDCSLPPEELIVGLTPLPPPAQITSRFTGQLVLARDASALYLDPEQRGETGMRGHELRKRLEGQKVYPAQVLDYYLAHPALIPESWKEQMVAFWGTIYLSLNSQLYVRCLCWCFGKWTWSMTSLDLNWGEQNPVAVRPS